MACNGIIAFPWTPRLRSRCPVSKWKLEHKHIQGLRRPCVILLQSYSVLTYQVSRRQLTGIHVFQYLPGYWLLMMTVEHNLNTNETPNPISWQGHERYTQMSSAAALCFAWLVSSRLIHTTFTPDIISLFVVVCQTHENIFVVLIFYQRGQSASVGWYLLPELSPYRLSPDRRLSSEYRRCLDESDFEPRETTTGLCSGRLSCLSDSFLDLAAACRSQTSLDFRQISSICS